MSDHEERLREHREAVESLALKCCLCWDHPATHMLSWVNGCYRSLRIPYCAGCSIEGVLQGTKVRTEGDPRDEKTYRREEIDAEWRAELLRREHERRPLPYRSTVKEIA